MAQFVLIAKEFFSTVSGTVFLVESILLTVAFILCLMFSIFRVGYSLKHRSWFFLTASGVVCAEFGTSILLGSFGTGFIMLFIALGYFAIIVSIRTLPDKSTDKQKDFVKYLNQSIYRAERPLPKNSDAICNVGEKGTDEGDDFDQKEVGFIKQNGTQKFVQMNGVPIAQKNGRSALKNVDVTAYQTDGKTVDKKGENNVCDIDFSHIKNVIDRLSYFSLSAFDKKQVKELELALLSAENNGYTIEIKEKINAGLGSLLKIMSKYGV